MHRSSGHKALLFLLPSLLGFVLFQAWPAARAFELSFTGWNLFDPPQWVGLANYAELATDELFWRGMRLSATYVALNIPLQTALGLAMALLMHHLTQSIWVKTTLLLPYLLSNVLVALVWLWLLDPVLGSVNRLLAITGVSPQAFFGSPDQALLTVAVLNTWKHAGLVALLLLSGLQAIPRNLYEAAALEGAGPWTTFRYITLPLLRPVLVFVVVTSVTGSFQVFDAVAVTTRGGPQDSTRVVVHHIVQTAFEHHRMGYASAMSVVLTACMLAYTALQMRLLRADESDL